MGTYLQLLEALHTDMIAALLGTRRGGAELVIAPPEPSTRMCSRCQQNPPRAKGLCGRCYDRERYSQKRSNAPCRECGGPAPYSTTGLCLACNGRANAARAREGKRLRALLAAPVVEMLESAPATVSDPVPQPVLEVSSAVMVEPAPTPVGCLFCGRDKPLTRGACPSCYSKALYDPVLSVRLLPRRTGKKVVPALAPVASQATAPSTSQRAIAEGDQVRITVARHGHPFALGDVGRVVEIERQKTATWCKVTTGKGYWHNFREQDLELVN